MQLIICCDNFLDAERVTRYWTGFIQEDASWGGSYWIKTEIHRAAAGSMFSHLLFLSFNEIFSYIFADLWVVSFSAVFLIIDEGS